MRIFILLLFIGLTSCNSNRNKENDGQRASAKEVAGILIPATLEPIEVREEFLPNGDGVLLHRYRLSKETYEEIRSQFPNGGKKLPFADGEYIDNYIYEFVKDGDDGVYSTKNLDEDDRRDVVLFVLNKTKMEFVVLLSKS